MDPTRLQRLAGVFCALGFGVWLVFRSGDPIEAVLWRDALWIVAVALGAYGAGIRRGRGLPTE